MSLICSIVVDLFTIRVFCKSLSLSLSLSLKKPRAKNVENALHRAMLSTVALHFALFMVDNVYAMKENYSILFQCLNIYFWV